MYLKQGQDPSYGKRDFWEDFFLLKPNASTFYAYSKHLDKQKVVELKDIWILWLNRCLESMKEEEIQRKYYALQVYLFSLNSFIF